MNRKYLLIHIAKRLQKYTKHRQCYSLVLMILTTQFSLFHHPLLVWVGILHYGIRTPPVQGSYSPLLQLVHEGRHAHKNMETTRNSDLSTERLPRRSLTSFYILKIFPWKEKKLAVDQKLRGKSKNHSWMCQSELHTTFSAVWLTRRNDQELYWGFLSAFIHRMRNSSCTCHALRETACDLKLWVWSIPPSVFHWKRLHNEILRDVLASIDDERTRWKRSMIDQSFRMLYGHRLLLSPMHWIW